MSMLSNLCDSKRPEFFEPMPYSPKKKSSNMFFVETSSKIHIKFEDNKSAPLQLPIRRKPIIRRRFGNYFQTVSILGKRKLEDTFGVGMNDKERYGQEIPPDFFKTNVGHNTISKETYANSSNNSYETQLNYWREKYQIK